MADPITWYALGRDVLDPETIMEAMDAKILTHNVDPSAHGQENESLYEHRAAALLDHLSYSIYNIKTNPAARVYKAIVGSGLEADFTTIQSAIDWAHLYGGGTVLIKAGTYNISSNLKMYSNITLQGEDDSLSVLDFGTAAVYVDVIGTSGTHLKNIAFKNIGFANGGVDGEMILIKYADDVIFDSCQFSHNNPTDTNQIVFIFLWTGANRVFIRECQFLSGNYCIGLNGCSRVWIYENYFYNQQRDAISGGASSHVIIRNNVFENIRLNASYEGPIYFDSDIVNLHIEGNQFLNCRGSIIYLSGMSRALIIDNRSDGDANTNFGITLDACVRCTIVSNNFDNHNYDGIILFDSDQNNITGNTFTNSDRYGIYLEDSTDEKNIVVANVITLNGTAIVDNGTGTINQHNMT